MGLGVVLPCLPLQSAAAHLECTGAAFVLVRLAPAFRALWPRGSSAPSRHSACMMLQHALQHVHPQAAPLPNPFLLRCSRASHTPALSSLTRDQGLLEQTSTASSRRGWARRCAWLGGVWASRRAVARYGAPAAGRPGCWRWFPRSPVSASGAAWAQVGAHCCSVYGRCCQPQPTFLHRREGMPAGTPEPSFLFVAVLSLLWATHPLTHSPVHPPTHPSVHHPPAHPINRPTIPPGLQLEDVLVPREAFQILRDSEGNPIKLGEGARWDGVEGGGG